MRDPLVKYRNKYINFNEALHKHEPFKIDEDLLWRFVETFDVEALRSIAKNLQRIALSTSDPKNAIRAAELILKTVTTMYAYMANQPKVAIESGKLLPPPRHILTKFQEEFEKYHDKLESKDERLLREESDQ